MRHLYVVCIVFRVHSGVMDWSWPMVRLLVYMDGRYLDMMYWSDFMVHWYFGMVYRGCVMHRHIHMVQHWLLVVIVSMMLLNAVNIWMMHGNLRVVDGGWMEYRHINVMENWLFTVVVSMVLLDTMHFGVMWSNWMSMCCSVHWKVLGRVMHIGVDV